MYLSFLLTLFIFSFLLCDLIFTRCCNFVTREAKYSSQTFNINTRNIHKGIFSCNRWWCVRVSNIAVEAYCRVRCVFFFFFFFFFFFVCLFFVCVFFFFFLLLLLLLLGFFALFLSTHVRQV